MIRLRQTTFNQVAQAGRRRPMIRLRQRGEYVVGVAFDNVDEKR